MLNQEIVGKYEMKLLSEETIYTAAQHLRDILSLAIQYSYQQTAVVIADSQCPLTIALTKAYKQVLPKATFIDFDSVSSEAIFSVFKTLAPHDLVVLIQSSSFRYKCWLLLLLVVWPVSLPLHR